MSRLSDKLGKQLQGDVLFSAFDRGRYATDASIYQVEPLGVVCPKSEEDIQAAIQIASEEGVPVLPRGAGTSQAGQSVNRALVVDTSKYLRNVLEFDGSGQSVTVEPGIVLDQLNQFLKSEGLFFPVDVATASRATIGGMTGNNSSGSRSIRYGIMADNVLGIDGYLASGSQFAFASGSSNHADSEYAALLEQVEKLYQKVEPELRSRVPKVLRHVAGYNLHRFDPIRRELTDLLVGSEGTLAFFKSIHLKLQPLPAQRVLSLCHFANFSDAMRAVLPIVKRKPTAVELFDRHMMDLAKGNTLFKATLERLVEGQPEALLLVEFSGPEQGSLLWQLKQLRELLDDLGTCQQIRELVTDAEQKQLWTVRKAGQNIMMSMKSPAKPIAFIEDCVVPLEHLDEYTHSLQELFARHGTYGTFYAHASVGCLHVRPVLNLKKPEDVETMRVIANETQQLVEKFKGSFSGEHGDGILRSEFIEPMLGEKLTKAFAELKRIFDPEHLFNPRRVVNAPKMDDRSLLRFSPSYEDSSLDTQLDWSHWGGIQGAVEMCNGNGACRKVDVDAMCPSYRVTHDEEHTTRGRANALRLALSGALGKDAMTAPGMVGAMELCVGCKACRRECPTGVDMARMKIEFLAEYRKTNRATLRDLVVSYLPRYARLASRLPGLMNRMNGLARCTGIQSRLLGISQQRELPRWSPDPFRIGSEVSLAEPSAPRPKSVVLFADTFNAYFEPENIRSAVSVLSRIGFRVETPHLKSGRPLCCGRTFLNAGLLREARKEIERTRRYLTPFAQAGIPIVGLEPSCLLTLKDEFLALYPDTEGKILEQSAYLLEDFILAQSEKVEIAWGKVPWTSVLVHPHCHQKAFGLGASVAELLGKIPDLQVETVPGSCCGMAGSFGFEREHDKISRKMAELTLWPAVRQCESEALPIADGTSCRKQILDGTGREAWHSARLLDQSLGGGASEVPP